MGVGNLAPHRIRARFAEALAEVPLPVRSFTGIDPAALIVIAETEVAERRLQFGVLAQIPRVWVTASDQIPPVLGYLSGLDSGRPELHLTESDHLDWARQHGRAARIKREGLAAWQAAQRECKG